jgi:7-alpha-hydroxysteroid dehydrogenase
MSISLEGKTAIVTGACNGVGLAISRKFVSAGANVVMAGVNEDVLDEEAEALGDGVRVFTGDLSEKLAVANLLAMTLGEFDKVDILVNANHEVRFSDPLKGNGEILKELLERNVGGTYRISQQTAKRMVKLAKGNDEDAAIGSIVNISASLGDVHLPQLASYAISCAALNQLTRSLATSFAPHRVRVNAVALAPEVNPCLCNALKGCDEEDGELSQLASELHLGDLDDVADAALTLASDLSGFSTGQILEVNSSLMGREREDFPTY